MQKNFHSDTVTHYFPQANRLEKLQKWIFMIWFCKWYDLKISFSEQYVLIMVKYLRRSRLKEWGKTYLVLLLCAICNPLCITFILYFNIFEYCICGLFWMKYLFCIHKGLYLFIYVKVWHIISHSNYEFKQFLVLILSSLR